jgi:hypothetical protein
LRTCYLSQFHGSQHHHGYYELPAPASGGCSKSSSWAAGRSAESHAVLPVSEDLAADLDVVLIMSMPGFGGQAFIRTP